MTSLVKNFLEELQPQTDVNKAIKPCGGLKAFESFCGLNDTESSKKKEGEENDLVLCMLNKLETKATSCPGKPSGENPTQCQNLSPVEDDEEPEPVEDENHVKAPEICGEMKEETKVKEESGCEPAPTTIPEEPAATESEQKPEEKAPAPIPQPQPPTPPPTVVRQPPSSNRPGDLHPRLERWHRFCGYQLLFYKGIIYIYKYIWMWMYMRFKKTKSSVGNLFQILQIPKGDYDISTLKSSNRYIPYASDRYKGKTYIYMEGDTSGDEDKYAFMSDTTDVTSSESEYEELDINDIYVPGSPKYKTLIEVVLEPSKRDIQSDDTPSSDTPSNKFSDDEWNKLKKDFISNMLQNTQNTEPNILRDNVDNNTHPTTSHHNVEEKPFIMSIHDRNLFSGEEISYNVNMVNSMNDIPMSGKNDVYSGIDLINDSLNSDQHIDIYDEVLKRKENELFGTNNTKKNTSTNSASKLTNSDPITNQLELFHKWLDRHRHMCDQWNKNKKEELLDELKEEWNKENNNNGDKTYNSDNKPSHNHVLNTDVSIQIDMDNPKPKNEFTNMDTSPDKSTMDTILDDLEKYNEPYYYYFYKDDIYYDVNDDDKTSMDNNNNLVNKNNPVDSNSSTYNHHNPADINKTFVDINNHNQHPIEKPTKIQIEMNSNNREVDEQQYPISDIWNI
ncbi:hypothetical protein PFFVO_03690 [Plasmodium falciparum Vietnam Oak-Knoll (FVO)]|uniref:Uncharacterized protein n=1 Tax=Plasmodium falciparum Vietnam Oak-Knoll (FVO) TaxID=1036723 RepID=A0A024V4H4_PLAFA|nr:hypothetical protein PFFVO_03690 [Plasmodium falciparum Vietnam Oak-Knoll (FVO)]